MQLKPHTVVGHSTTSKGRCAIISIPTLERLRLDSIVSYSMCGGHRQLKLPIVVRHNTRRK